MCQPTPVLYSHSAYSPVYSHPVRPRHTIKMEIHCDFQKSCKLGCLFSAFMSRTRMENLHSAAWRSTSWNDDITFLYSHTHRIQRLPLALCARVGSETCQLSCDGNPTPPANGRLHDAHGNEGESKKKWPALRRELSDTEQSLSFNSLHVFIDLNLMKNAKF